MDGRGRQSSGASVASGAERPFAVTVGEIAGRIAAGEKLLLLDVREDWEREIAALPGELWIPLGQLPARAGELAPESTLVVYCHHGGRSAAAVRWLRAQGLAGAVNLVGGIDAWSRFVDPGVARY